MCQSSNNIIGTWTIFAFSLKLAPNSRFLHDSVCSQAGSVYCSHGMAGANKKVLSNHLLFNFVNEEVEWFIKYVKHQAKMKLSIIERMSDLF